LGFGFFFWFFFREKKPGVLGNPKKPLFFFFFGVDRPKNFPRGGGGGGEKDNLQRARGGTHICFGGRAGERKSAPKIFSCPQPNRGDRVTWGGKKVWSGVWKQKTCVREGQAHGFFVFWPTPKKNPHIKKMVGVLFFLGGGVFFFFVSKAFTTLFWVKLEIRHGFQGGSQKRKKKHKWKSPGQRKPHWEKKKKFGKGPLNKTPLNPPNRGQKLGGRNQTKRRAGKEPFPSLVFI